MNWLGWLSLAVLATSVESVMNRKLLDGSSFSKVYLFGYKLGGMILLLPFIFSSFRYPAPNETLLLLAAGISWYLGALFNFKADEVMEVNASTLIAQLKLLLVIFGSWIAFGEHLTLFKFFGIALIVAGIHTRLKCQVRENGIFYKIAGAFFISVGILIDRQLSQSVDAALIVFSGYFIPFLVSNFRGSGGYLASLQYITKSKFLNLAMGMLSAATYLCLVKAMRHAPLSILYPLYQIYIPLTILFSYLLLKEKISLRYMKRALAMTCLGSMIVQL